MDFCRKGGRLFLLGLEEMFPKLKISNILGRLSLKSKVLLNLALVLIYGYLLATSSEWSGDHVEIGCIHVLTFLPTLQFLFSLYTKQFFIFVFRLLSTYGCVRILLYLLFLLTFSYAFVAVLLDRSALTFMNKATDLFLSRFENNIKEIKEDRLYFDREAHRFSCRETIFRHVNQLVRYPMEDAEMNCSTFILGYPGGEPFTDQVEWRQNGVPLKNLTDRHSVVTQFKQLTNSDPRVDEDVKALGFSVYRVTSVLSIYLLNEGDFGSYTCHIRPEVKISLAEWMSKTGQKSFPNFRENYYFKAKKKPSKKQSGCQCTCLPERKYIFQDAHSLISEFRIIRMKKRHDQIEAPVMSILFFSTTYLHLSTDVRSDYTVKEVSIHDLCSDEQGIAFGGCSSLQRLLAYFIYDENKVWWFLHFLPLSYRRTDVVSGEHLTSGHCLCENSFGRHSVKYTRTYYNRTSGQNEMFEITHPHTLLVRPPKQNSSNLFASILNYGSVKLLPLADYLPEYAYDLNILKDLAIASGFILKLTDWFFIGLGVAGIISVSIVIDYLLKFVGQVSKKCLLEGSMGFLVTAVPTSSVLLHEEREKAVEPEKDDFDIFVCLSDSQADTDIVTEMVLPLLEGKLGLTMCLRHKDLPPNELELAGLSQAIENSKRFIIMLSEDFLKDPCREMETAMIIESLWERHSKLDVLVIKLDGSLVPAHWIDFTVHDWTSGNLSVEDHRLRLLQWVTSYRRQGRSLRSALDILITFLPFILLSVLCLIIWIWARVFIET